MFACNGILFNHESPRRGETFVTRKITRALARIKAGLQEKLFLGNLDAKRDWGYAARLRRGDVADAPAGRARRLRRSRPARRTPSASSSTRPPGTSASTGRSYVEIDPRYFRPAEVDVLLRRRHEGPGEARLGADRRRSRSSSGSWSTPTSRRSRTSSPAATCACERRAAEPASSGAARRSSSPAAPASSARPSSRDARRARRRRARHPLGRARPARPARPRERRVDGAEIVIHLAANVGGIGFNRRNPAPLVYDNLMMAGNVFEQSRAGRRRASSSSACTVCAYPKFTPVPFSEDDALGRLPGGVQRAVRAREEDDARALRRLPAPVRLRLVRADRRQPLRARTTTSTSRTRT